MSKKERKSINLVGTAAAAPSRKLKLAKSKARRKAGAGKTKGRKVARSSR